MLTGVERKEISEFLFLRRGEECYTPSIAIIAAGCVAQ